MVLGHQTLGDAVYRCAAYCRAAGAGTGELLVGAAAEYHRKEYTDGYDEDDIRVLHSALDLLQR